MSNQITDRERMEQCYDRTHRNLWLYLYRIVNDEDDTYDVLQNAYIRLISAWERIKHLTPDRLDAYLFVAARNQAYRFVKRRKKTVPSDKMDFVPVKNSPESAVENAEQRELRMRALQLAVSRLPDNYKKFVCMKFFKQMTNVEISQTLRLKPGSVRMLQTRAMYAIRKYLFVKKRH